MEGNFIDAYLISVTYQDRIYLLLYFTNVIL